MIFQLNLMPNKDLLGKLERMQESGELCDFSIIVSGTEIKAHKCVLAANSEYFRANFSFNEQSKSSSKLDLTHMGWDAQLVKNVIRSFYTYEIYLDTSFVESILEIVDYLMVDILRDCIESFLQKGLSYETALAYFRLAMQYGLSATSLCYDIRKMMVVRFHDYFIYKSEALELSLDVINSLIEYHVFQHCNPLQLVEFMLTNAHKAFEKLLDSRTDDHINISKNISDRAERTFHMLSMMLGQVKPVVLEIWKPHILSYLKTWPNDNTKSNFFSDFICRIRALELEMSDKEFDIDYPLQKKNYCHICLKKFLITKSLKTEDAKSLDFCSDPNCQSKNLDPNIQTSIEDGDVVKKGCLASTSKSVNDDLVSPEKSNSDILLLSSQIKPDKKGVYEPLKSREATQLESIKIPTFDRGSINSTPDENHIPDIKKELDHYSLNIDGSAGESATHYAKTIVAPLNSDESHTSDTRKELDHKSMDTDNGVESYIFYHEATATTSSLFNYGPQPPESHPRDYLNFMFTDENKLEKFHCNILVVLAPSTEMASELVAIDDETYRPLIRSPQLELCIYDIDANTWYGGIKLDFPISGALCPNHHWRTAFFNDCLYMFSRDKEIGLEFNISNLKWTRLDCKLIFARQQKHVPVSSIVPIKVGNKLIVLSLSRKMRQDGDYLTHEYYFEMVPSSKTFIKVASVHDATSHMPISRWTVSGDVLIIIKASTMMYNNLFRIQFVHFYNAKTRQLQCKQFDCTMEAGVKLLVRDQVMFLLDREGWCRSYCMKSLLMISMQRYPIKSPSSSKYSHDEELRYPAMTHVTCHAGSSRWEITTSHKSVSACMQELTVNEEGLSIVPHPPPPFQFLMTMCHSSISRSRLNSMERPKFMVVDNQMMNFSSISNQEINKGIYLCAGQENDAFVDNRQNNEGQESAGIDDDGQDSEG